MYQSDLNQVAYQRRFFLLWLLSLRKFFIRVDFKVKKGYIQNSTSLITCKYNACITTLTSQDSFFFSWFYIIVWNGNLLSCLQIEKVIKFQKKLKNGSRERNSSELRNNLQWNCAKSVKFRLFCSCLLWTWREYIYASGRQVNLNTIKLLAL